MTTLLDRRQLLRGAALGGGGLALAAHMPAWAQPVSAGIAKPLPTVSGEDIRLTVGHVMRTIDGRRTHGIGINGTAPAPLIRLREGQNVRLHVENTLDEETSIHWHGLLLPFHMDGVPGVSFPGIPARSTFTYEFPVIQSGTYWYHSHSGLQEQEGHYGPIVIDPKSTDPVAFDREHVIVLSDASFMHPHAIFRRLKLEAGYFNRQRQTLGGLLAGKGQTAEERAMWGKMRMDPTDIADVTGSTYTYLANGYGPRDNWTALFRPGERVRLRFINASAMTIFNVRIPGLPMTIVQADGSHVRPVETDEFQISVAETYDVVVRPTEDRAYSILAESVARMRLQNRFKTGLDIAKYTAKIMREDMAAYDAYFSGQLEDYEYPQEAIAESLAKGESVQLIGFGSFSVQERAAREGRNPQTGKTVKIAAKKVVKFKAGTALAGTVNKK